MSGRPIASSRIRIVHILSKMDCGGIENWLMNVVRRLDPQRFHVTFCLSSTDPGLYGNEIRDLGADIVHCALDGGVAVFLKRLRKVLEEVGCDVVHSHMLLFSGLVLRTAQYAGVPVRIAHIHSKSDGYTNSWGRRLYRRAMRWLIKRHATVGLACSTEAAWFGFGPGWQKTKKFRVNYCGIDLSAFRNPASRADLCGELGMSADLRFIGHVGAFRPLKNHRLLIDMMRCLREKHPEIHLLLIGQGPERKAIEAYAKLLSVDQAVSFLGLRTDVPSLMRSIFDVVAFPSLYEGLGLVVVEAQCAGKHVLMSERIPEESVVIDELVHRQRLGDGPEVWAARIVELLEERSLNFEEASLQIRQSPFNLESSVRFLKQLYISGIPDEE